MTKILMNYRKNLLRLIFGLIAFATLSAVNAGGYDQFGQAPKWQPEPLNPAVPWAHYPRNFYFGVSGGYAWVNWTELGFSDAFTDVFNTSTKITADDNGYTWGLLMGYQFSPHFAIEAGGYDLFDGNRQIETADSSAVNQQLFNDDASSYIIYGALKAILPVHSRVDIFAKLGPVYRSINHTNDCSVTNTNTDITSNCSENPPTLSDSSYWSVFVAAGAETYLTQNVTFGVEWYYVPSNSGGSDSSQAPSVNAIAGIVSYAIHPLF